MIECLGYQKLYHSDFLRHHRCEKCSALHEGATHGASVNATSSDLIIIIYFKV